MPPPWSKKTCPSKGNLVVDVVRRAGVIHGARGAREQKVKCTFTLEKGGEKETRKDKQTRQTFKALPTGAYSLTVSPTDARDKKVSLEVQQVAPEPKSKAKAGYFTSPHTRPVQIQASKTTILRFVLSPPDLVLKSVDRLFAPGVDELDTVYDIQYLENEAVWHEIESDECAGKLVCRYALNAAQKATGTRKKLKWGGKANQGATLNGKWINPPYSPYRVILRVEKRAPLELNIKHEKPTKVVIEKLDLTVAAARDRIIMNDPARKVLATSKVWIKRKSGSSTVTPIEIDVTFTFTENAANKTAAQSFQYQAGKTLGKKGDAAAIHWAAHAGSVSSSADGYKTKSKARTITAAGPNQGVAKVWFLPSGVGGNKYTLKAETFDSNGTTSLASKQGREVTVWRKIKLNAYQMVGQNHVSTHGTTAVQAGYYTGNTFVEYELGTVTRLPANRTVRYIGLWDHATSLQLVWATHRAKTTAAGPRCETPTAAEKTASNGAAGAARTAARAAIQTKANIWRDRLIAVYDAGIRNWAPDAGVPVNSLVAIEYEHPKYTAAAPNADSVTNEWSGLPWLTIRVETETIHPDQRWIRGQGLSSGQRAYITAGMTAARTRAVIAHEIGHETKNQFRRAQFGAGDHSAAAGLMDPYTTRTAFTAREKDILRGLR